MKGKKDQKKYSKEWEDIQKQYPAFARAHLAQQAILMEAIYRGDRLVARRMGEMLSWSDTAMIFRGYWDRQHRVQIKIEKLSPEILETVNPTLACIGQRNRDPPRCFDLSHGWFEDPFAEGQTPIEPPKPPIR